MGDSINPRDLVAVVFRHKKKVLLCTFLVFGAAVVATAVMQPRFRSEAMLFLRLGRENVALDPIVGSSVVAIPQGREDEINSVVEILKSRELAEQVVDRVGTEAILALPASNELAEPADAASSQTASTTAWPAWAESAMGSLEPYLSRLKPGGSLTPRDQALEKFQKMLSVWAPKRSTVVYMAYEGPTPETAQQVVSNLLELYLEQHVRLNRTAGAHDFFVEQTGESRQRLDGLETELRDMKTRTGMASVEDQRKILVDRIGRLEDNALTTNSELVSMDAELAALNEKLDRLPETRVVQRVSGMPNQAADLMRQQLYALQLKEQELLSVFNEDTRQVREIRRQIQEAQGILAKQEYEKTQSTNAADPTFQQLHLTLHSKQTLAASLRAKLEKSREQLAEAKTALAELNDHELKIAQLRREVELQESTYKKYSENLEQARIDQALKLERISNLSVAQPATFSPKAHWPKKTLLWAAGLLGGFVAGAGLALVLEYFDHTLKTEQDLEQQLELTPLVCVPRWTSSRLTSVARTSPERHGYANAR
jgi:uncharacterized protein involved in exopolysaccharide biosynthesis